VTIKGGASNAKGAMKKVLSKGPWNKTQEEAEIPPDQEKNTNAPTDRLKTYAIIPRESV